MIIATCYLNFDAWKMVGSKRQFR